MLNVRSQSRPASPVRRLDPFPAVLPALAALIFAFSVTGCGMFSAPKSTTFRWAATTDLNHNDFGEPNSVLVKVLLLKNCGRFLDANLDQTWIDPEAELGDALVADPIEATVLVGEEGMLEIQLAPGTTHIGVIGSFNELPRGDEKQRCCSGVSAFDDVVHEFKGMGIVHVDR